MKKVILCLLCIFSLFLLEGCGLSNTPKGKVEAYLNQYNNLTDNIKVEIESAVASEKLSDENKEKYKELLTNQYQNMKYEIKDESIEGDNATVIANIEVINLYKAESESKTYLNEHPDEFNDSNGIFSDDIYNTYRINSMKEVKDRVEYELVFRLNKKNNDWVIESLDRDSLEKLHGLYDYTSDN